VTDTPTEPTEIPVSDTPRSDYQESLTPNVVVSSPAVRKVINWVLGVALIVFPAAGVLDASSPDLDFSQWLIPATAVTSFLAGIFGLAVTTPNIPKR
jgi:hypothetical protein